MSAIVRKVLPASYTHAHVLQLFHVVVNSPPPLQTCESSVASEESKKSQQYNINQQPNIWPDSSNGPKLYYKWGYQELVVLTVMDPSLMLCVYEDLWCVYEVCKCAWYVPVLSYFPVAI